MNIDTINALIAAMTSLLVALLSHMLIRQKERKQLSEQENVFLSRNYINPMRFMLAENYYRIKEIMDESDKHGRNRKILIIEDASEILDKNECWFAEDGCYLLSSCYITGCLLAYMEKIRGGAPFFQMSGQKDTQLIGLINRIVIDFSSGLNIYYVIQMDIGKHFCINETGEVISYKEFCQWIRDEKNFKWYKSLIDYYLRIGRGEHENALQLLEHIKQLSGFLDNMVKGGDSIRQKLIAERDGKQQLCRDSRGHN